MEDLGQAHPLRGRIWDASAETFVDEETLISRLAVHGHVLLGERHDNPRHHALQARVLAALVKRGRRPDVAWEMITDAEGDALATHIRSGAGADGLGAALRWEQRGWPPWRIYSPVAQVALGARLRLLPAGIDRRSLFKTIHGGPSTRPSRQLRLPEPARQDLARTLRDSHCGHAKGRMLEMMVQAQELRDAHMARRLAQAKGDGTVLIAGNGHVRRDRGVPFHIRLALADKATMVSLGILEVSADEQRPGPYAAGVPGLGPAFDYVWFTVRVDNVDPCEKFRQRLERMRSDK